QIGLGVDDGIEVLHVPPLGVGVADGLLVVNDPVEVDAGDVVKQLGGHSAGPWWRVRVRVVEWWSDGVVEYEKGVGRFRTPPLRYLTTPPHLRSRVTPRRPRPL